MQVSENMVIVQLPEKVKTNMLRIVGAQLLKVNLLQKLEYVRPISVQSCMRSNKSKVDELAEKKRIDQEMRWTKLYHFRDMKYHAIVTRLKIYPFLSTVLLTPIAFLVEAAKLIDDFSSFPCLVVGKCSGTIE